MTNRWKTILVSMALLICSTSAWAAFQWQPIDPGYDANDQIIRSLCSRYCYNAQPGLQFDQLPEGATASDPIRTLTLDKGHTANFVIYGSAGGTQLYDRLAIDLNGDKKFSSDEIFTGISPDGQTQIELKFPDGLVIPAKVQLMQNAAQFHLQAWLKGTVQIDGREVPAVLANQRGGDYDLNQPGTLLLLDLNGNGKFDADFRTMQMSELVYLLKQVLIGGKLYDVTLTENPLNVTLTASTAPQGKLDIEWQIEKPTGSYQFFCYSVGTDPQNRSFRIYTGTNTDLPIALPTGPFTITMGGLTIPDASGGNTTIQFAKDEPIQIEEGQTAMLKIGKPTGMEIQVSQNGDKLSVKQTVKDANGLIYKQIMAFPKDAKPEEFRPKGPAVKILAADGSKLAEGNMEYG